MPDKTASITRSDRGLPDGQHGVVIWLTGLSGAGKSTIAKALERSLLSRGRRTCTLDGDLVRQGLCSDLGFSMQDRQENIRRVAEVARLMMDAGLIVTTALISPLRIDRERAKLIVGSDKFFEIHVSTPLQVCEERDVKGLYRRAREGSLQDMTGIDSIYEAPGQPHLSIDTSAISESDAVEMILSLLPDGGRLASGSNR